jgi:dipeptidyl aminopeptidase/acylaminoacyl peptidase
VGCPIQACPRAVEHANPATYASHDDPPFLILHGTGDLLVPHHQSEVLFRALRRACAEVRFTSLEGRGHEHGYLDETPATWDALVRYLTRALAGQDHQAA